MQTQCDNEHLPNWPTWTLLQISFLDLLQALSKIFLEYEYKQVLTHLDHPDF